MVINTQTDLKAEIRAILQYHVGRENAITAGTIGERLGLGKLKNTYPVREAIAELIKSGYPVCSDDKGFWQADTWQEVISCAEGLRDRGIKVIIRRRDLLRAAENYFNGNEQRKLM